MLNGKSLIQKPCVRATVPQALVLSRPMSIYMKCGCGYQNHQLCLDAEYSRPDYRAADCLLGPEAGWGGR